MTLTSTAEFQMIPQVHIYPKATSVFCRWRMKHARKIAARIQRVPPNQALPCDSMENQESWSRLSCSTNSLLLRGALSGSSENSFATLAHISAVVASLSQLPTLRARVGHWTHPIPCSQITKRTHSHLLETEPSWLQVKTHGRTSSMTAHPNLQEHRQQL